MDSSVHEWSLTTLESGNVKLDEHASSRQSLSLSCIMDWPSSPTLPDDIHRNIGVQPRVNWLLARKLPRFIRFFIRRLSYASLEFVILSGIGSSGRCQHDVVGTIKSHLYKKSMQNWVKSKETIFYGVHWWFWSSILISLRCWTMQHRALRSLSGVMLTGVDVDYAIGLLCQVHAVDGWLLQIYIGVFITMLTIFYWWWEQRWIVGIERWHYLSSFNWAKNPSGTNRTLFRLVVSSSRHLNYVS